MKTIEEMLLERIYWEDSDQDLTVSTTEDNKICVSDQERSILFVGDTFEEALAKFYEYTKQFYGD